MKHEKMNYTYIGIDSHKDTHTAVLIDCFFEKLGQITFKTMPSEYGTFLKQAHKLKSDGTTLIFGLEDTGLYGRSLVAFLNQENQIVKHVSSTLVAKERKAQDITQKTDSIDALCAARVLLSKLSQMPDANNQDKYWILRSLVVSRDRLVRGNITLKMHLHTLLTQHYPNYRDFFVYTFGKTSLAFFDKYPSPSTLSGVTVDELAVFFLDESSDRFGYDKAEFIIKSIENTTVEYQEIRDMLVQSTIRQIRLNLEELERMEESMRIYLDTLGSTLTSMAGIDIVSACQILSCIGDIKRFSNPGKLARYAGIAPVTYASGGKDLKHANKRGNRELNSLFYRLAVRVTSPLGPKRMIINNFFYEYFHKKMAEGKTKRQAMKCVERRLVNIIWTMLTNEEDYVGPPILDIPENGHESEVQADK